MRPFFVMNRDIREMIFFKRYAAVALVIASALLVGIFSTRQGVNYYMDSTWYLVYARSIQLGEGLSAPITSHQAEQTRMWISQWPPLYPMLLALGDDLMNWARLTSIVMLVLSAVLTYTLAYLILDSRRWLAILPPLLFLSIPSVTGTVFSYALSEALFVPLALSVTLLLTYYRFGRESASMRPALLAAALVVLLSLTRYLGIVFSLIGFLYMLMWARTVKQPNRWLPAIMFALAMVPLGLFALYLWGITGQFTGVQTVENAVSLVDVRLGVQYILFEMLHGLNFAFALVGLRSNWWGLIAALTLFGAALAQLWPRLQAIFRTLDSRHGLLGLYLCVYLLAFWILAARSDAVTANDLRHFVVIYPVALILVMYVLTQIKVNRFVAASLLTLYAVSGIAAIQAAGGGLDYNAPRWHQESLLAEIGAHITSDSLVFSQEVGYLSYFLGDNVTVRMFGGDSAFLENSCKDLVYPSGYRRAVFTLFDSHMLRETNSDDVEVFMRDWAAPCGTVQSFVNTGFALITIIDLNEDLPN